ncbi:MAG: polysaccharide deacetylase family protein [Clostridia bacterium]|nr:polysaccharide deacetylase family protein [Clostridia bacterium]
MYFAIIGRKTLIKTVAIISALAVVCTIFFSSKAHVVFGGKPLKKLPIYYVQRNDKKISVSFDCAWGVTYTDQLLSIMEKQQVKCTFFTVEFWAKKYPDYLSKIAKAGHEIGTHSATHPHMAKLDKNAVARELTSSSSVIKEITGVSPTLFRAPFGEYNDTVLKTAEELGLYTIQWDVDSLDWKDLTKEKIAKRVLSKVKSGSIVLFHNQGKHTAEALEEIIVTLKNQGYTFVPIGELIYKNDYEITADGGQRSLI